jgi:hypothetical protein
MSYETKPSNIKVDSINLNSSHKIHKIHVKITEDGIEELYWGDVKLGRQKTLI